MQAEAPRAKRHKDTYDDEFIGTCEGLEETRIMLVESMGEKEVNRVERLVDEWITEIRQVGLEDQDDGAAQEDDREEDAAEVQGGRQEVAGDREEDALSACGGLGH